MEECCKFVPIIVNGKYVGGNIVYCSKHAAAPDMYEALETLQPELGLMLEGSFFQWNPKIILKALAALKKAQGE